MLETVGFVQFLDSLACQILNDDFKEVKLKDFNVVLTCLFENPNRCKQDFTDVEQYPLAPTSIGKRCTFQPLDLIEGSY